ncbi:MAG: hypothetical protein ACREM2_09805, partial [Vulcanimicrobiaceae bacterium]
MRSTSISLVAALVLACTLPALADPSSATTNSATNTTSNSATNATKVAQSSDQAPAPKKADPPPLGGHLPIVDLTEAIDFSAPGATPDFPPSKNLTGPGLGGVLSGVTDLGGTITIPLFKGVSASYDRQNGGLIHSTFAYRPVFGTGGLSQNRFQEVFRLDAGLGHGLGFEVGTWHNWFLCCPFNVLDTHLVYAQLAYTTPPIAFLHNTTLTFVERGARSHHTGSQDPGGVASGLDIRKDFYGSDQILVTNTGFGPKFTATGVFYNGDYDMFEQEPFPFRFNIFEAIGTYSINPELSLQEGWANLWQQN